jgi:sugar-specific transcriptional regulator TrmB
MAAETALENIGLDQNEVKIYSMLLKQGSSLAGTIAEKTGIHRRTVYDALEKLMKKSLVTYVLRTGKKHFQAVNPERILLFLKEKHDLIEREENEIKGALPELQKLFNASKTKAQAEIYSGKEGLKSIMELILKEKADWLSIGSTGKGPEIIPYFLPSWHRRRVKIRIKYKGLIADTVEGRKRAKEFSEAGLADYRFLPKNLHHPQTIWVFGNKTAIILVSVEVPIITLIESDAIADSFREYFNLLWKQSQTLKK